MPAMRGPYESTEGGADLAGAAQTFATKTAGLATHAIPAPHACPR